ncbi:MAG: Ig-like domain-containing protein, partial [Propionibacteriaceae bacterium]|nr:Ig-like domain-containing protein [Propionibacteriaceae bacterium]
GQTKVADGVETHRAEVQVRDAHNNPVGTGTAVTFTMTPPSGAPVVKTETTNAQGVAVAQWAAVKAGDHTVTATVNAQAVGSGDGSTARFVPGAVDPARSTFQVTGDVVLNNGVNQHAATVIARDAHDNVIGSVPVELTISEGEASIPGPVLNPAIAGGSASKSLTTNSSGSASSAIVSEEEGTFTVEAKIGPSAVSLGTKTVDFAPGSPSVVSSSWWIAPANDQVEVSEHAPAESFTVTVEVRSGNGLPVGNAAVRLSGENGDPLPGDLVIDEKPDSAGYWTTGDKTSNHYGQAVLHVRSAVAADFEITAQILPDQWPDVPGTHTLRFKPSTPDQGESTFTITPESETVGGHATATFTIKDAHGNGVPGLDPVIDFIPPLSELPLKDTANWGAGGVYTWDLTSSAAATYTGAVTLDVGAPGADVVKTAQVVFQPGEPAAKCTPSGSTTQQDGTRLEIDGLGPLPVDDDENGFHVATATVVDEWCNPVPNAKVEWSPDSQLTVVEADTKTNEFGQAFLKVKSKKEGEFKIEAEWTDPSTPVKIGPEVYAKFVAGSCKAVESSFTVDKTETAVGGEAGDGVVFTIAMRDVNGNACSDTVPTVVVDPAKDDPDKVTHAVVGPPKPTGTKGEYTVRVSDKAAETVDVSVLSGSDPVEVVQAPARANPQPIKFTVEEVPSNPPCVNPAGQQFDGSHITVDTPDAVTADGQQYHDVTAVVVDRFCNPITGFDVDWQTEAALSQVDAQTTVKTDADGVAKLRVTSTVAGSHKVVANVTAGNTTFELGGSPQLATFQADECQVGPGGRSWFDVDKTSAVAGSSDGIVVTMTLLDPQGNACSPPSDATLAVTAEGSTTAVVTNPSGSQGTYTSTVTDTVAETVDLKVTLGADDVDPAAGGLATKNPQPVTFTAGAVSQTTSTWAVTPEQDVSGSVFTGTLVVKDGLGNPVPGLDDAQLDLDADGMQVLSGPDETAPGVYTYTATQTAARPYTLAVTLNNGTDQDTSDDVTLSDTVTVTSGPIESTVNSHVTVSPAKTGVGQHATVTVHLADGSNNPITDLTSDSFTVTGREVPAAGPATDIVADSFVNQGAGDYTFQITSQKARTYAVHATVETVDLADH